MFRALLRGKSPFPRDPISDFRIAECFRTLRLRDIFRPRKCTSEGYAGLLGFLL
jgi:hypothetical protein